MRYLKPHQYPFDKQAQPAYYNKIIESAAVVLQDILVEQEIIHHSSNKADGKSSHHYPGALVFTPRYLYFKLRIQYGRLSFHDE